MFFYDISHNLVEKGANVSGMEEKGAKREPEGATNEPKGRQRVAKVRHLEAQGRQK